jgi:hypothetical protein
VEPVAELQGQFAGLVLAIERDGLAHVVHDDLAGIALRQMALEFLADRRIHAAIHVVVEQGE